jgi:hypothetical protein
VIAVVLGEVKVEIVATSRTGIQEVLALSAETRA